MANFNLEQILGELNEAEKTAEQSFAESILDNDAKKEKVSESTGAEKVAEKEETSNTAKTSEKTATAADTSSDEESMSLHEKVASLVEDKLVKVAGEFGKIAAMTFFNELAAMGVAMPTNYDANMIPPVSQVSQPQKSPVTVAADAKEQLEAGHDAYDKNNEHVETPAGYMKMQKKASFVTTEFVKNLTNKIYQGEDQ